MKAKDYVTAILSVAEQSKLSPEQLTENLLATIHANGHSHLLKRIARVLEKETLRKERRESILVTSAQPMSEQEVSTLLRESRFKEIVQATHKQVKRLIDPTLGGGVVVRTESKRLDISHKRALLNLYHHITN